MASKSRKRDHAVHRLGVLIQPKRPSEPIAPANIPGERLDPKILPVEPPASTPTPQTQDVEYDSRPETRVNNAGVEIEPKSRETPPRRTKP